MCIWNIELNKLYYVFESRPELPCMHWAEQ